MDDEQVRKLRSQWIGTFIEVVGEAPELARFGGRTGEVYEVTCNGLALVDFLDGPLHELPPASLRPTDQAPSPPGTTPKPPMSEP